MRKFVTILLFTCCVVSNVIAQDPRNDYTLYLVRHAEKQADGSRDPVLTETGINRSLKLAGWFRDKDITDVWSSDYIRTRDTAEPLLSQLNLQLNIYDPGDQSTLVSQLFERQNNALVVGHSNTIPDLARLLCNCTIADMDDSEHERIIVIAVKHGKISTKTLMQNRLMP